MARHGGRSRIWRAGAVVITIVVTMVIAVPASATTADDVPRTADKPASERHRWVSGELLVRYGPGVDASARVSARSRLGLTRLRGVGDGAWELVRTRDRTTPPREQATRLQRDGAVAVAQPNFVYHPAATLPDDSEFDRLWGLHNTGQTVGAVGTVDADIDAPEAWQVASDQSGLVVAVTDTGVWTEHPDLAANMWTNAGEIAGDGVDNDGNGYADDVHGWDFYNNDASVFDEEHPDDHGTHVAGTIAAVANNASHVAGVSNAKIMALKFLGPDGGSTADGVDAINYAVANGADVINASWGGGDLDLALQEAIQSAGDAGILLVAAAGNDAANNDVTPSYPASYALDNIVAVAATTNTDGLASFSNYGALSVHIGAPGQSILSTVPQFGKAILVGPDTPGAVSYHSAYHSFGLEGVPASDDRQALVGSALDWVGATASTPILVVDDDAGMAYEGHYTGTLTALGYTAVTTHTVGTGGSCGSNSGPTAAQMDGKVVIWLTGDDFGCWHQVTDAPTGDSTLTTTDQSNLTTHLDNGGELVLFGQDVGYDLTDAGTVTNTFLTSKLKTGYIADFDGNFRLLGQQGTAYAGLPTIELDGSQSYSSALLPLTGAEAGLRGSPTAWFSGTSMAAPHVAGAAAVVHATFPALTHLEVKARLLANGDAVAALDGKTSSGKRLNLNGALGSPTVPTVPDAPTGVAASASNSSATVSWTPPADDGGSAITGYTITTYQDSAPVGTTPASSSATSATVTGLTNGASYTFTVYATNGVGDGPESAHSSSVTPVAVPGAPTGVSATAGDAQATVTWTPPADDGGSDITGYTITIYKSGTSVGTTSAAATATSATVTGLTNGASYAFTVSATNGIGGGPESAKSNSVTPKGAPAAPTNVSAAAAKESATVTWTAPSDGGSAITSYTVTAHTGGQAVTSLTVPGSTTTATVIDLTPGTAYTFTVTATNSLGTGPSSSHSNQVTIPVPRSGYWMVGSPGNVHAFGDAGHYGNAALVSTVEDIEPTPSGNGYWIVDGRGFVAAFGDAPHHGGLNGALQSGEVVTAISATPAGNGYWLFTSLGRVATFGGAQHLGDMTGVALNGPVLDSVVTPSGNGYYMVGSDGGIFAFGDAAFYGSMGGTRLNAPVQSLVPDGDGVGYWLVASDGGIFAFDAAFYGSMGGTSLNQPITGMVASGSAGYLMVASDGGIFAFGSAPFHGSLGANPPPYPIVAAAVLRD